MATPASKRFPGLEPSRQPTAAQRVHELRWGGHEFKTRNEVTNDILADLFEKGEFLSDGRNAFWKPSCLHWPILLAEGDQICQQALSNYFITPGEKIYGLVLKELQLHALQWGKRVTLRRFSYYDSLKNVLYFSNQGQRVIRITKSEIQKVPNGTDGVLFYEPDSIELTPVPLIDDPTTADDFRECILDSVCFVGSEAEEAYQREIFELYLLSLFFPELMPTRPILMLVGEPGSGKTYTLGRIGRLLCGDGFHVSQMPNSAKDFDAIVTNQSFAVLDDVEASPPWLNDKLAVCATGGEIATRELYTTNQLATFKIVARIALSAHSPRCRRGDVSDRLIVLEMPRHAAFKPCAELDKAFGDNRARVYSGLLYTLQGAVAALADTSDYRYEGSFRMADFASFAMRIASARDEEGLVKDALEWVISRQKSFTHEENPLLSFLEIWVEKTGGTSNTVSTGNLFATLRAFAFTEHLDFSKVCANSISLGKKLAEFRKWDDCPLAICSFQKGGHVKVWSIGPANAAETPSPSSRDLHTAKQASGEDK